MQFSCLIQETMKSFEVETNHPSELSTVQEDQELWLNSGIKVHLNLRGKITVYSDMFELLIEFSGVLIIALDLGNDGIPFCSEVQQCIGWALLVQICDQFR